MATLKAKKLQEALSKAKKVGLVEEPVTITGCEIVLTNLQPEQFEAIIKETSELEDVEYVHAYQLGHVCRSIIEIDGVDLRDVDFIEVEVEDKEGQPKTVKVERHEWVRDLVKGWGREAITVAWRKFCDVLQKAENAAKEGVTFQISEETPEEKFRRVLDEAKEVEGSIPPTLVQTILEEKGYLSKASQQELEEATARVDALAREQEQEQASEEPQEASQEPLEASEPQPPPQPRAAPKKPPEPPPEPREDVQQMMAQRRPLNRTAVKAPVPAQRQVVSAQEPVPAPPHIKAAAASGGLNSTPTKAELYAAEQASLERLDPGLAKATGSEMPQRPKEVPELRKQGSLDGGSIAGITDQRPQGGINPRYHKPPGLR